MIIVHSTFGLALAGLLLAATTSPEAGRPPGCTDASHARLVVQAGRDVCGPTLLPSGPVSVGFLPTVCTAPFGFLTIDAIKLTDMCVAKPSIPAKP